MSYYANELREHGRNYFDEEAADELDRLEDENSKMREALETLAKLGNEPYYGNSVGNQIALNALSKIDNSIGISA